MEKGVGFSSYDYPKKAKFYADFKSVEIIKPNTPRKTIKSYWPTNLAN